MMKTKWILLVSLLALAVVGAITVGCNQDRPSSLKAATGDAESVGLYYPLDPGYSSVYQVDHSDGTSEQVRFEVGTSVPFVNGPAIRWFRHRADGSSDTTFFQASDSVILHYETVHSIPERILQLPLKIGASWTRYSADNGNTIDNGFTDIITGILDKGESDSTDDGFGAYKSFPTLGSNDLTVAEIGSLQLETGAFYGKSVRISNAGVSGQTNHYWYVAGIGLVRYVIGATESSFPDGETVGVLIDYGQI